MATIQIKRNATAGAAPAALFPGELAVNTADARLWVGNAANSPLELIADRPTLKGRGMVVPLYVYPHTGAAWAPAWQSMFDIGRTYGGDMDALVIVNPSSGPGAAVDAAYGRGIDLLRGAKCIPIGYVATGYGAKTAAQIIADIDQWLALYPTITGFFFDEVSTDVGALPVVQQAVAHARSRMPRGVCVGNPGVWVDNAIALSFDVCVTYENQNWPIPPTFDYVGSPIETENRMAVIVSGVNNARDKLGMLARYWRYVFVTTTGDFSLWDADAVIASARAVTGLSNDPAAVLRTLVNGWAAHAYTNTRLLGTLPVIPRITVGTGTAPSGYTRSYTFGTAGAPFTSGGGEPVTVNGATSFPVVTPNGSNRVGRHWRVSTLLDGTGVAFLLDSVTDAGGGYRFLVDGRYVSLTGTLSASGTQRYYTLDWPARGKRVVTVEGYGALRFWGAACPDASTLLNPPPAGPRLIILGDSDLEAYGEVLKGNGPGAVLGDFLGTDDVWAQGVYGTGFVATNGGASYAYNQRRADWAQKSPAVLLLSCSINDPRSGASVQQIVDAIVTEVLYARSVLAARTPILVSGFITNLDVAEAAQAGATALLAQIETSAAAAITALGDADARFIPVVSAGYPSASTGAAAGQGNYSEYTDGATYHATPAGYVAAAIGNARGVATACAAMAGVPMPDPVMPQVVTLSVAYPRRLSSPKIAGDYGGSALTTQALTAARQYFVPVVVPRQVALSGLRLSVTTAAAGTASAGLYANTVDASGNDAPGALLAGITGLDTGTTGDKTGTFSAPALLQPGTLYWVSVIGSAAATLRALAVGSRGTELGRTVNNTTAITYLYAAGSGSTLPATAAATPTAGTGNTPAVYLVEV